VRNRSGTTCEKKVQKPRDKKNALLGWNSLDQINYPSKLNKMPMHEYTRKRKCMENRSFNLKLKLYNKIQPIGEETNIHTGDRWDHPRVL
jgi:hypothetical protein